MLLGWLRVNEQTVSGQGIIMDRLCSGHESVCALLLSNGADVKEAEGLESVQTTRGL
jgi:hypothetical protein